MGRVIWCFVLLATMIGATIGYSTVGSWPVIGQDLQRYCLVGFISAGVVLCLIVFPAGRGYKPRGLKGGK